MKRNGVRVLAAALGAAFIIGGTGFSGMQVLAASATVVDTCNVRKDSTQNSEIVTQASGGSTVTIGDAVTNDAGETWYPVTLEDGTTGYIKSTLLNISSNTAATEDGADEAASEDGADAAEVTSAGEVPEAEGEGYAEAMTPTSAMVTGDVNIRSGAGTEYTKIGELTTGTELVVIGQAKDSSGDIWYQFYTTGAGQQMIGFIRYDYLSLGDPVVAEVVEEETTVEEEPAEKPDYEAVYTADDTGAEAWYLYNNVSGTRKKIADMESAVDEANAALTEAKASVSKSRNLIIALIVVLVACLAAIIVLFMNLRRAKTEGGEIDLMSIRKKQEKERQLNGGDDRRLPSRRPESSNGVRAQQSVRRPASDAGDRPVRRESARPVRSAQDPQGYAPRRTQDSRDAYASASRPQRSDRPVRSVDREVIHRDARPLESGSQERMARRPAEEDIRTDRARRPEGYSERPERRDVSRPAESARREAPAARPEAKRSAQNFAGLDDDDDFQFIDVRNDD